MTKFDEAQATEFRKTLAAVDQPLVEPTADEKRNGWDAEELTKYLAEQQAAASLRIHPHSLRNRVDRRGFRQVSKYNPFRWRRRR